MRFADIENIWMADLGILSNADRGRVYYERAKQVIVEALADPIERKRAVTCKGFRRDYLVTKIGSQPSVTTQNPKIRQLLVDTDQRLALNADCDTSGTSRKPSRRFMEIDELHGAIATLRRHIELQAKEITELRRQLRELNNASGETADHGSLP